MSDSISSVSNAAPMGRVAIITRTKDRPLMLPRARQSVENQKYRDFIWVVVNDAGIPDYVEENAESARQKGIDVHVLHRERSVGMEAASNAGVRAVDTEYVVIHDDDDSWHPDFLNRMVRYLDDNREYVGAVCRSMAVFERMSDTGVTETGRGPYNPYLESIQIAGMAQENPYAPISFLFRRSVYDQVGGYDESLPVLGDWDFNLRVLLKGDIGVVPETLANYHIRENTSSGQATYGNSITAGVNAHVIHDARYRNRKIREDVERGQMGLGFLLFQGRQTLRIQDQVGHMYRYFHFPRSVWRKLKRRLHRNA